MERNEYIVAALAIGILCLCTVLLLKGFDGEIKAAFISVIAFYFGRLVASPKPNG